jgi:uncharacterized membrane protein YhaH (DUF805 family)
MNYAILALKQYANFSGRATRSEYWYFFLVNALISIVISLGSIFGAEAIEGLSIVSMVYSLAMFIPGLSICARRLHDIGKSGWMMLVVFIPFVGGHMATCITCD